MILSPPVLVHLVAGARPNFMKIAPLYKALSAEPEHFCPQIVHTGQHYDLNMSETFFREFQLPKPDLYLGVGSGSHAQQTAKVMTAYEEICLSRPP
nr:UDP-N-acetylglucosamine 2-epimerase [bacterium]